MRVPEDAVLALAEYAELLLPNLRRARERHRGRGPAGFEALLDELIAVAQESRVESMSGRVSASLQEEVPPLMVPTGTADRLELCSTREVADAAKVDATYVRRLARDGELDGCGLAGGAERRVRLCAPFGTDAVSLWLRTG